MTNIDGKNRHPGNAIEELKSTDYQNYVYMQVSKTISMGYLKIVLLLFEE